MSASERKVYIRLIYRRTFRLLGALLALAALVGGLYGARLYFLYALAAIGSLCVCVAWFGYLGRQGMRPFSALIRKRKISTPYAYQRDKYKRVYKPSFMKDYRDFDDDLTDKTAVSCEIFSEKQAGNAKSLSIATCGAILILLSMLITV